MDEGIVETGNDRPVKEVLKFFQFRMQQRVEILTLDLDDHRLVAALDLVELAIRCRLREVGDCDRLQYAAKLIGVSRQLEAWLHKLYPGSRMDGQNPFCLECA